MKISFRFFEQVLVDAYFRHVGDRAFVIEKVFPVFLGRPARPHLSFFLTDKVWRPHFTAAKGSPRQFRGWLPRISPEAVGQHFERFAGDALRSAAARLEPVNLRTLEEEGWLVHWADLRVLRRWIKYVYRQSGEFRVDRATLISLYCHVLRHADRPTSLEEIRPVNPVELFVIRNHAANEPEMRMLEYLPAGLRVPSAVRAPYEAHPPGWYLQPSEIVDEEAILRILPTAKVEEVAGQIEGWLSRYPRRGPSLDAIEAELEGLPGCAVRIFGFYSSYLLDHELAGLVEEVVNSPRRAARTGT